MFTFSKIITEMMIGTLDTKAEFAFDEFSTAVVLSCEENWWVDTVVTAIYSKYQDWKSGNRTIELFIRDMGRAIKEL